MSTGPARALTTRRLDFWLLGGASLVTWAVLYVAQRFRADATTDARLESIGLAGLSLALLANYPHFLASYKLAYGRGGRFVATHWPQLVAAPLCLAGLLASAFSSFDTPVAEVAWLASTRQALAAFGVNAQVVSGPRLGDVYLTCAFTLMTLTIGWHYAKQVFGCVMVYAHFDGYPLSAAQRHTMKWALLAMWAVAFADNNRDGSFRAFNSFNYSSLDLPDGTAALATAVALLGAALVGFQVFVANYRTRGRLPSPNIVVPIVALYVWWLPTTRQDEFYFVMAPLFHSIQYLAFVWKVEGERLRRASRRHLRAVGVVAGVIVSGWLAFEGLPQFVDAHLETSRTIGLPFFAIAAMLFLNIHHYFIDNVLWRFSDPHVRAHLLD